MNYFIFKKGNNSYDSRDYGIGCGGFPPITIPSKRITIEDIPGRNGSLISSDDCYCSYSKNLECYMDDNVNIDLSWLKGSGKLILSNELNREYDVTIKNKIDLELIGNYYRNFLIQFEVQPFKKSTETKTETFNNKEFTFEIGGNVPSFPLIFVNGNGNINITINNRSFLLKNIENNIIIDTELQMALEDDQNALYKTNGDFPYLDPGINNVVIIGNLEQICFEYKETFI